MKIRAIIFDLDDTLYPEHQYVQSGFRAVDAWLVQQKSIAGFFSIAWNLFLQKKRGTIFDDTLRAMGHEPNSELIQRLVQVYREHYPDISLHPDACEFFKLRWGYKFGLLTDGYLGSQQNKVKALGIASLFSSIIYTDALGGEHWKPSEKPFREIETQLGEMGPHCVYVGDNPKKDFLAPRALGWTTVRVSRPDNEYAGVDFPETHQAQFTVSKLTELPSLLQLANVIGSAA